MSLSPCIERSRRVFVRRMTTAVCRIVLCVGVCVVFSCQFASARQSEVATDSQGSKTHTATGKDEAAIKEDALKQQLAGKFFYLRNGYFDNSLRFNEFGQFQGSSPKVSYTLSLIKVEKVHLSKRALEIQGIRYALHFQDEGPTEDALSSADKVRITPKKKVVTIPIDRAQVDAPKKQKTPKHSKKSKEALPPAPGGTTATQADETAGTLGTSTPAGANSTQAHANQLLKSAINAVFSPGLDERMVASLPDYWRLYFRAAENKTDYRPANPAVLRQNAVERKARLLSTFEPPSNDFAQAAGVSGLAVYHVVIGPDGKPTEIAVGRPIGFGLDENAVDSILKASFEPALKDGKPVPVVLDVMVQFRIYSERTKASPKAEASTASQEVPANLGSASAKQP